MGSEQSVSQRAHKGPAASTAGSLAPGPAGHTAAPESITFDFNQEVWLLVFLAQIMRRFYVEFMLNTPPPHPT